MLTPLLPWQKLRERRKDFVCSRRRPLQTDDTFLTVAAHGVSEQQRELQLLVRRIIAASCGLEAEALHAEDNTHDLDQLIGQSSILDFLLAVPEGPDWSEFFMELEDKGSRVVGHKIHVSRALREDAINRWRTSLAFGAWAGWLAEGTTEARR